MNWYLYTTIITNTIIQYVKTQFDYMCIRLTEPIQPLRIYKVLKIKESHDVIDCTNEYLQGNLQLNLNEDERVEYRYMWTDRKNRMISTNEEMVPNLFCMTRKPPKQVFIIKAILFNEDENLCENVIDRVLKYAGPQHDFYNEQIKMEWLFENDDLEEARVFLFMMYSDGRKQCVRHGEYIKNKIC